jgi:hypothetical protein
VIADGLEHPATFSSLAYQQAVEREQAAAEAALPIELDGSLGQSSVK